MCNVYDRYTGKVEVVSMEAWHNLNKRNYVKGIKMIKPRFELMCVVNPNFSGLEV